MNGRPSKNAPRPDWLEREPGWHADAAVIGGALWRGRSRPLVALALAAVASVLAAYLSSRGGPFEARVVIRIEEGGLDSRYRVLGRGDLRHWISDAALSSERLLGLIEEHGLYPAEREIGEELALESFRDDLGIEVFANYFLESGAKREAPRSARVAITYSHGDLEVAGRVARELADLVVDFEAEQRRELASEAIESADYAVERAERALEARRRAITEQLILLEAGGENRPEGVRVEIAELSRSLASNERLLEHARRHRERLRLRFAEEEQRIRERFSVVNVESPAPPRFRPYEVAIAVGVTALLFAFPFSFLAAGAFDDRLRDLEDLRRLRRPVLGAVPAPRGRE